ncbi:Probable 18S rRNA (guanine-N(7))-methyltransferase (Bud site selection protein 23 homolog) (Williams-Beuren syndrome chromosomal region 22 protein homolog) [Durusdinium trenchii]|uniref:Probable 18S rRNA (Guanine-N(7))-methyltransferase (Bud site selection protein 23 homolog) (Williams-Beuren syndrome chromosomal region 22 protein homolog) n=1 Tax=Durusdinium trenchii TaxID=1381693 RepID=A0ABP0QPQ3_9DINO
MPGGSDEPDWLYGTSAGERGWFPKYCVLNAPRSPPPPLPPPPPPLTESAREQAGSGCGWGRKGRDEENNCFERLVPEGASSLTLKEYAAAFALSQLEDDELEAVICEETPGFSEGQSCGPRRYRFWRGQAGETAAEHDWGGAAPVSGEPLSASVKRTFCKFWQENKCTKGDSCTFAHGDHEIGQPIPEPGVSRNEVSMVSRKKVLCKFWQEGNCFKSGVRGRSTRHKPGDRSCTCAMHLRHALLHAQELGQLIDNELARLFGSRKSDLGSACSFQHSEGDRRVVRVVCVIGLSDDGPAVILPLGKGAVQAVLVGDQCQLPATVLSQEAQKGGLDISMFDRLLSMGMEVQFLSEQYRMHPQIASFSSWRFYRGELKSARAVSESQRQLPRGFVLSSHVVLLHVEAGRERGEMRVVTLEGRNMKKPHMKRPEHQAPPEIFYNDEESERYATSSRMIEIQTKMTERALELLLLPDRPCLLLDVGCGSGISGETLSEAGHLWVGYDISPSMLRIARSREVDGDLFLADAGQGLNFRPGTFDGAVSISALQWLCNVDKKGHEPFKRLRRFFELLYSCLRKGARAALQLYPETAAQVEMITAAALRCGFGGGLVVDYPHSAKAKKHFLVIYAGLSGEQPASMPEPMEEDDEQVAVHSREREVKRKKGKAQASYKDKVLKKKEHQRKKGFGVRKDTKYTARPRKSGAF